MIDATFAPVRSYVRECYYCCLPRTRRKSASRRAVKNQNIRWIPHWISSARTPDGNRSGTYARPLKDRGCPPICTTNPGCSIMRASGRFGAALCLRRLSVLLEIASQELTHIWRPLPLPSNGKHFACRGRNIFPYHSSSSRMNLLHAIRERRRMFSASLAYGVDPLEPIQHHHPKPPAPDEQRRRLRTGRDAQQIQQGFHRALRSDLK